MFQYLTEDNRRLDMTTLSFNDIEFDVIDNVLAKRYSKFLMENINQSKEFYFMGDKLDEILSEIDKIVYMYGKEPTRDMNKLHDYFADHEDEPEMSRLNNLIHYYELCINNFPPRWGYMVGDATMELFRTTEHVLQISTKKNILGRESKMGIRDGCWILGGILEGD